MGYTLMVFEPSAAPAEREPFLAWYNRVTDWDDGDDYEDYEVTSPRLRCFFIDMVGTFPPLNGPLAKKEHPADDPSVTGYSIGRDFIYLGEFWEKADDALRLALDLAKKHRLGVFDRASEKVWLSRGGEIEVAFGTALGTLEKELVVFRKLFNAVRRLFGRRGG